MTTLVESEKEKYKKELNGLKGQKAKLENKRQKLLEAHYGNAIPLDLLKTEQQKIAKELATIEHEIRIHNTAFEAIIDNLKLHWTSSRTAEKLTTMPTTPSNAS